MRSAWARWAVAVLAGTVLLGAFHRKPWRQQSFSPDGQSTARETLAVGYLPVTCHLTCPVTDFASRTRPSTRFESMRFMDFPTVVESLKGGRLHAAFLIAPLAMKLRSQGHRVKIVYLGHRDGSTVIVREGLPVTRLRELKGRPFAIPSRYSNQYLVLRRLMEREGLAEGDLHFVELPPPEMPAALAAKAIDAYFVGEPHAARAELDGTGRVLYYAKDIWPKFISCVLVVTETLIAERPRVVSDLVRGIAESGEWADENRLQAAALVAPYFRQDERLLRHVLTQPPDRVSYRMLVPEHDEMQRIADMAVSAGLIENRLDVRELVDTRFIPDSLRR